MINGDENICHDTLLFDSAYRTEIVFSVAFRHSALLRQSRSGCQCTLYCTHRDESREFFNRIDGLRCYVDDVGIFILDTPCILNAYGLRVPFTRRGLIPTAQHNRRAVVDPFEALFAQFAASTTRSLPPPRTESSTTVLSHGGYCVWQSFEGRCTTSTTLQSAFLVLQERVNAREFIERQHTFQRVVRRQSFGSG